MRVLSDLLARARALVFRRREEAELDEELRFHLEMQADHLRRSGASPGDAGRLSRAALGGVQHTKDQVRDARGTRWLEELLADLRFAFRAIRRAPAFAATLIGMLAIGIGANTTIFGLVDAVVLRSLPVPHPEELVSIGNPALAGSSGQGVSTGAMSYPLYQDIRDRGGHFTGVLAAGPSGRLDVAIGAAGALEHPIGRFVSANYFTVLGVPPWRGRVFDAADDQTPGGSPFAVISHGYWTRRFHQDSSIAGSSLVLNGARMTIVGVAPPSFSGEVVGQSTDIWLPISMHDVLRPRSRVLDRRSAIWLLLLGRLAPGVTIGLVRGDLEPFIIRTIAENAPGRRADFLARHPRVEIGPGHRGFSDVRGEFAAPLVTIMVGVALLLAIICANAANLLLARAIARGSEFAVRLALGAGRGRLLRLLLTESLVLALLGAAAGLLLAIWGSRALLALASDGATIPLDLRLDGRVLGFTFVVSLAAVVLFGLAPALRASRGPSLRGGTRGVAGGSLGSRGRRPSLGNLLIGGQVALSVVLLAGATMLTRSLRHLQSADVGLDRDHLLVLDVDVAPEGYQGARLASLAHTLRDRLAAVPGVAAVTYSENGLFTGTEWSTDISVPGFVTRNRDDADVATDNVGAGYVRSIGGRLLEGRDIAATDETAPVRVAVVNRAFAAFYFPNQPAVGRYFVRDSIETSIVGVVADIRDHTLEGSTVRRRAYSPYVPTDTLVTNPTELRFAIRTSGDPAGITEQVRKTVASVDPQLPIDDLDPLARLMHQSIREERLVAQVASAFGLLAMLLASIGLYGVLTYAVRRRTGEIGLRAALGAQRTDLLRLVLTDALRVVAAGLVVGVPTALAAARLLRTQLHGVPAVDPLSLGVAMGVLAGSALIAALLPAFAAARVTPLEALRAE